MPVSICCPQLGWFVRENHVETSDWSPCPFELTYVCPFARLAPHHAGRGVWARIQRVKKREFFGRPPDPELTAYRVVLSSRRRYYLRRRGQKTDYAHPPDRKSERRYARGGLLKLGPALLNTTPQPAPYISTSPQFSETTKEWERQRVNIADPFFIFGLRFHRRFGRKLTRITSHLFNQKNEGGPMVNIADCLFYFR